MANYVEKLNFETILIAKDREIDALANTGIVSISAQIEIDAIAGNYKNSFEAALKGFDSETTSFSELEKVMENLREAHLIELKKCNPEILNEEKKAKIKDFINGVHREFEIKIAQQKQEQAALERQTAADHKLAQTQASARFTMPPNLQQQLDERAKHSQKIEKEIDTLIAEISKLEIESKNPEIAKNKKQIQESFKDIYQKLEVLKKTFSSSIASIQKALDNPSIIPVEKETHNKNLAYKQEQLSKIEKGLQDIKNNTQIKVEASSSSTSGQHSSNQKLEILNVIISIITSPLKLIQLVKQCLSHQTESKKMFSNFEANEYSSSCLFAPPSLSSSGLSSEKAGHKPNLLLMISQ